MSHMMVSNLDIEVIHKSIKNLHLGVYPPDGRVRVAAPLSFSEDSVRLAVIDKLSWIKRQRAQFQAQPRQSKREMVTGESHYFLGRRYRLSVIPHSGTSKIVLRNQTRMDLYISPDASLRQREQAFKQFYREQLKALMLSLVTKWQEKLGVQADKWGIRKMKTKWGSCKRESRQIWLNLELAKKPQQCIEYVLVHELLHLEERNHNQKFKSLLDRYMPNWEEYRDQLNSAPLCHDNWKLVPKFT